MKKYTALLLMALFFGCGPASRDSLKQKITKPNPDIDHFNFTVAEAPEWTALFNRSTGWFGGDGIFAIPLSQGNKNGNSGDTSDSTMFIFSDTMVGDIVDGVLQPGVKMIHNSVAYLSGNKPIKDNIRFYYDQDKNGNPETIFVPRTPNTQKGDYYWLGDGFANNSNGNIYIFAYRMRNMNTDDWSFKEVGNTIIAINPNSRPPFTDQRQVETPFSIKDKDGNESGSLGAGIFVNTKEAGALLPDGYVYVYGVRGKEKNLVVSRVLPENFEVFSKWEYWNGSSWSKNINDLADVANDVSNELSVSPLSDGRYALVFQVGGMTNTVGLRLGLSPYGPFGPTIKIWDCQEGRQKNYITYNAKAYPEFSGDHELLISYNVNAFDFMNELKKNPNLYRPRFIRVKYE